MLLPTLLLLIAPTPIPLDDCEYCEPSRICSVHAEEDREVIKGVQQRWKKATEKERIDALKQVAALTAKHENHRSADVAKCLGNGLDDDSFAVRETAAKLLGEGQHPATAIKAMTAALSDLKKDIGKATCPEVDPSCGSCTDSEACSGHQSAGYKPEVVAYAVALIDSLGSMRDDRAAKALVGFLTKVQGRPYFTRLQAHSITALVRQGRRDGVQLSVELLASLGNLPGSTEVAAALAKTTAERKDLETEAPGEGAKLDAWAAWLDANTKSFPKKLGKAE